MQQNGVSVWDYQEEDDSPHRETEGAGQTGRLEDAVMREEGGVEIEGIVFAELVIDEKRPSLS